MQQFFSCRRLTNGRKVSTYDDYIAFLLEKHPNMRMTNLDYHYSKEEEKEGKKEKEEKEEKEPTAIVVPPEVDTNAHMASERKREGNRHISATVAPRSIVLYMLPTDFL